MRIFLKTQVSGLLCCMIAFLILFSPTCASADDPQLSLSFEAADSIIQAGTVIHFRISGNSMDDYYIMVVTPDSRQVFLAGPEADYTVTMPGRHAVIGYGEIANSSNAQGKDIYMSDTLYFTAENDDADQDKDGHADPDSTDAGMDVKTPEREDWLGLWESVDKDNPLWIYIWSPRKRIVQYVSITRDGRSFDQAELMYDPDDECIKTIRTDDYKARLAIDIKAGTLSLYSVQYTNELKKHLIDLGSLIGSDNIVRETTLRRVRTVNPKGTGIVQPFERKLDIIYSAEPYRTAYVTFSSEMFQQNTRQLQKDIAYFAMALSAAAYGDGTEVHGEAIANAYGDLGVSKEDIMLFNCPDHPLNKSGFKRRDMFEFSIASKDMGDYALLLIVLRGSGDIFKGSWDWNKNFQVVFKKAVDFLDVKVHPGFYDYVREVETGILQYTDRHPEIIDAIHMGRLKVLLTGHSLGGGTANLLGAYLTSYKYKQPWVSMDDMFVYAFATPRTFYHSPLHYNKPATGDCSNIINIVVNDDPVPTIPKDGLVKWIRFGRTWVYKTTIVDGSRFWVPNHHLPSNYIETLRIDYFSNKDDQKYFDVWVSDAS